MREVAQAELKQNTQQLLDGPLKHVRAAALAAALVPLASLIATPASAQVTCGSGGTVCGVVFNDVNKNGVQDAGEGGIEGVPVLLIDSTNTVLGSSETGSDGIFYFSPPPGDYFFSAETPQGFTPSPFHQGGNSALDSDGQADGLGHSVSPKTTVDVGYMDTDFGFFVNQVVSNPGTGTLGYWKNHPAAWPNGVTIAGVPYTTNAAIWWMQRVGKDRTTQMFAQLVAAKLNVGIGNDPSCIASTIAAADAWLTTYPVGSNVLGSSPAWSGAGGGETLHDALDAYNNGNMCAPHRK
jgi:hypothetical protein